MQLIQCYSKTDKPGKDERPYVMPIRFSLRTCPDCDKKRTTVCKDPNCKR